VKNECWAVRWAFRSELKRPRPTQWFADFTLISLFTKFAILLISRVAKTCRTVCFIRCSFVVHAIPDRCRFCQSANVESASYRWRYRSRRQLYSYSFRGFCIDHRKLPRLSFLHAERFKSAAWDFLERDPWLNTKVSSITIIDTFEANKSMRSVIQRIKPKTKETLICFRLSSCRLSFLRSENRWRSWQLEEAQDNPIGSARATVLVTVAEAVKEKETPWSGGLRGKIL